MSKRASGKIWRGNSWISYCKVLSDFKEDGGCLPLSLSQSESVQDFFPLVSRVGLLIGKWVASPEHRFCVCWKAGEYFHDFHEWEVPACFPGKCIVWLHPIAHLWHLLSLHILLSPLQKLRCSLGEKKDENKIGKNLGKTRKNTKLKKQNKHTGWSKQDSRSWEKQYVTG